MTRSMTAAVKSEMMVSTGFRMIIVTSVAAIVMTELMTCGILWLKSCLNVSTSFVYTDMISPWAWVSKYLIGSASILRNRSSLNRRMVPWLTLTMIRL